MTTATIDAQTKQLVDAAREAKQVLGDIVNASDNDQAYTDAELKTFALPAYNKLDVALETVDFSDSFSTTQPTQEQQPTWSGSPDPCDPDKYWIDDGTGERVSAITGERTQHVCPSDPPTPRPWMVQVEEGISYVVAPKIALVATLDPSDDDAPAEANAALIVRAVNAHDGLVAALREALNYIGAESQGEVQNQIREALKLAEAE